MIGGKYLYNLSYFDNRLLLPYNTIMANRSEQARRAPIIDSLCAAFPKATSYFEKKGWITKINSPKNKDVEVMSKVEKKAPYVSTLYISEDSDQEDNAEETKSREVNDAPSSLHKMLGEFRRLPKGLAVRRSTSNTYFESIESLNEESSDEDSSEEEVSDKESLISIDEEVSRNTEYNKKIDTFTVDASSKSKSPVNRKQVVWSDEYIKIPIYFPAEPFIDIDKEIKQIIHSNNKATILVYDEIENSMLTGYESSIYESSDEDDNPPKEYESTIYAKEAYKEDHPIDEEAESDSEASEEGFSTEGTLGSKSDNFYIYSSITNTTPSLHQRKPSGSLSDIFPRNRHHSRSDYSN